MNILIGSANKELRKMVAFTVMTVCEIVRDDDRLCLIMDNDVPIN